MIEDNSGVRIKAWGPLKIFLFDYVAPDIMTAGLVYMSMLHGFLASLILNNLAVFLAVFFVPNIIPDIFKLTLASSIFYGSLCSLITVGKHKNCKMQSVRKIKIITRVIFYSALALYMCWLPFMFFSPSLNSGFVNVYIVYCIVHPFILCLAITFLTGLTLSDLIRLISRGKK